MTEVPGVLIFDSAAMGAGLATLVWGIADRKIGRAGFGAGMTLVGFLHLIYG